MDKILRQLTAFFKGLTLSQRLFLGGGIAVVGSVLWLFVYLLDSGDYKPLYSGMAPADAQSLGQKLAAQNIAYQISPDGTSVLVRSDQLDRAGVEVPSQGPRARGGMGSSCLTNPTGRAAIFRRKSTISARWRPN